MRLSRAKQAFAALLLALVAAGTASAQTIKPLDVEQDPNGVDLLSGKIEPRVPVLSVPGAPNLRLEQFSDLVPRLEGLLIPNTAGRATFSVNSGGAASDSFNCNEQGDCLSRKRNGAALIDQSLAPPFEYYEGGSGKLIYFDLQNGPQTVLTPGTPFEFFPSYIRFGDGEQLNFTYDTATPSNQVWRRPTSVTSSLGYTMTLTYQGDTYGQFGWSELAQATIAQTSNPSVPLARLTYSGEAVTDLAGRQWTCAGCRFSLVDTGTTTSTALRLPTESSNAFQAVAEPRTYGSVTHQNWVTRVTNDGVDWNYSYVPGPIPQTLISQVTITAPLGFSRTVNIDNPGTGVSRRSRITSIVNSFGQTTSYQYDNDVRVTRITRPEGNAEAVVYDGIGNITERRLVAKPSSGLADIVETAWYGGHEPATGDLCFQPSCFKPIWTRDALNRQTDYTWADHGLLTRLEPADAEGRRRKTINEYDGQNRLLRERTCFANASGVELTCGTSAEQVRAFTYWNNTRLPLTETATDGVGSQSFTTTHNYDSAGRRLSSDGPLPGTDDATYYRYDIVGRRTWEIGPLGISSARTATRTTYRESDNNIGAVESGTVPDAASASLTVITRIDYSYDTMRNRAREAVSAGGITYRLAHRSSDARGRIVCEARRMNPAVFASVTENACVLGTGGSFGSDRITRNIYDADSRVVEVIRASSTPIEQRYANYTYSPNGLQISVTDANSNRAELRLDGHDRQVRWVFPSPTSMGSVNEADYEAYVYDANGNRTSLRRRDNTMLTYQYDALNRVLVKTVPTSATGGAGYTTYYGYDVGGRQAYARFGSAGGRGHHQYL